MELTTAPLGAAILRLTEHRSSQAVQQHLSGALRAVRRPLAIVGSTSLPLASRIRSITPSAPTGASPGGGWCSTIQERAAAQIRWASNVRAFLPWMEQRSVAPGSGCRPGRQETQWSRRDDIQSRRYDAELGHENRLTPTATAVGRSPDASTLVTMRFMPTTVSANTGLWLSQAVLPDAVSRRFGLFHDRAMASGPRYHRGADGYRRTVLRRGRRLARGRRASLDLGDRRHRLGRCRTSRQSSVRSTALRPTL